MSSESKQNDIEDFVSLITRWNTVLYEQQVSTDINAAEPSESQLQIIDDKNSDMAHMKNLIDTPLHGGAYIMCKDLCKVAMLLKISHISFSTISEVLIGLIDLKTTTKRVGENLKKCRKSMEFFLDDVQGYVTNMEREALRESKEVSKVSEESIGDENFENNHYKESELITEKKVAEYIEGARAHLLELEESDVFSLCPKETAENTTSCKGIGPLPHSGLISLSMIIKEEDKDQNDILSGLTSMYGDQSYDLPCDRISVECEIESLQLECQILEEQLNEALHANT
jgi:hypothetical protein